jgi:hypothetical protein
MGVKFIKIDDKSKALISKLVDAQQGATSAYEAGKNGDGGGDAGVDRDLHEHLDQLVARQPDAGRAHQVGPKLLEVTEGREHHHEGHEQYPDDR